MISNKKEGGGMLAMLKSQHVWVQKEIKFGHIE